MRSSFALALLACSSISIAHAQDRDGDRVPDAVDLCPDAREGESTAFPGDGCPDTDGDRDGIVDDYDSCPSQPETRNGFHDLDGCPDSPSEPSAVVADPTRIGCFEGAALLDVAATAERSARLVPRPDAPLWLGTTPLDCYAGLAFEGRRAVHCANASVEATLAFRVEAGRAIGMIAVRSAHGIDRRAWSGTPIAPFDRQIAIDAVLAHEDEIQACYEHARAAAPALAGRVQIAFTVETSGEVDEVRVASDTLSPAAPEVGACLVALVRSVAVAPAPRCTQVPVTVSFAFELER